MEAGESHAGIAVPEGDPEALRELGRTFGGIASGLGAAAESFAALPGELADWRGPASVAFAATASESNAAAHQAMIAFARKRQAADAAAEELQAAQDDARDAIREARDAEQRIDAALADVKAARKEREAALERAASADLVATASDVVGPASLGALADRQRALEEAEQAEQRQREAQRRLERAEDDLDQAKRRGRRIDQRAEELSADVSRAVAAAAPANALASLGGPATGIGGMPPLSPLAALGSGTGTRPLLPLGELRGAAARAYRQDEVERSPVADLLRDSGLAIGLVGAAAQGTHVRQKEFDKRLRRTVDPVTRANFARGLVDDVTDFSSSGTGRVARRIPLVGPVLDVSADRAEDRSWLDSLGHAASKAVGGAVGGAAGGLACAPVAVFTGGTGAVSCPAFVTGGAVAGSEGAGLAYNALAGAPEKRRAPLPLVPLIPLELLRDDMPPLRSPEGLAIDSVDRLRPLDQIAGRP